MSVSNLSAREAVVSPKKTVLKVVRPWGFFLRQKLDNVFQVFAFRQISELPFLYSWFVPPPDKEEGEIWTQEEAFNLLSTRTKVPSKGKRPGGPPKAYWAYNPGTGFCTGEMPEELRKAVRSKQRGGRFFPDENIPRQLFRVCLPPETDLLFGTSFHLYPLPCAGGEIDFEFPFKTHNVDERAPRFSQGTLLFRDLVKGRMQVPCIPNVSNNGTLCYHGFYTVHQLFPGNEEEVSLFKSLETMFQSWTNSAWQDHWVREHDFRKYLSPVIYPGKRLKSLAPLKDVEENEVSVVRELRNHNLLIKELPHEPDPELYG